jgi:hypothetical protein
MASDPEQARTAYVLIGGRWTEAHLPASVHERLAERARWLTGCILAFVVGSLWLLERSLGRWAEFQPEVAGLIGVGLAMALVHGAFWTFGRIRAVLLGREAERRANHGRSGDQPR